MKESVDNSPTIASISSFLASCLYRTLIYDLAIEEHKMACRRRNERALKSASALSLVNNYLAPPVANTTTWSYSRSSSPSGSPFKKEKDDSLYDCLNCGRSIGAPRYASHLSSCMGVGSSRRGGETRRAAASKKNGASSRFGSNANGGPNYAISDDEYLAGTSKNIIKIGGSTKRSASAQPPGSSKPKKARSSTPLIPSSLGNPPSIFSHPLEKTFSAPIPALGQSLSSVSLFNPIPRDSSPMATSQTLPILPSISHIPERHPLSRGGGNGANSSGSNASESDDDDN